MKILHAEFNLFDFSLFLSTQYNFREIKMCLVYYKLVYNSEIISLENYKKLKFYLSFSN